MVFARRGLRRRRARLDRMVEVAQVHDRELAGVTRRVGVLARHGHALERVGAGGRAGAPRADVRVGRVGDVDHDHLAAADAAALHAAGVVGGGVVEVVADEDEALERAVGALALAVAHRLVLEHEVGERAGQPRVQRIAGVEHGDAVEARHVEEVAGPGELARDALRVRERVDQPHVRAGHQRQVRRGADPARRAVGAWVVGERDGRHGKQQRARHQDSDGASGSPLDGWAEPCLGAPDCGR